MKQFKIVLTVALCALLCFAAAGCGVTEPSQQCKTPSFDLAADVSAIADAMTDKVLGVEIPTVDYLRISPEFEQYLPADSKTRSDVLAEQALLLCSGYEKATDESSFVSAGLTVLEQVNYDKAPTDVSHTCAYTIGQKQVTYGGETRALAVVAVRGTGIGEWYSNFDFCSSKSDDSVYAENFLSAATDLQLHFEEIIADIANPLVLVCGHSRGGAVANLLAAFQNAKRGQENVFAYTFATPNTVKRGFSPVDCANVFNYVNEQDVVPQMPLSAWGYERLGTDVTLSFASTDYLKKEVDDGAQILAQVSPSVKDYYGSRFSLTGSGVSEDGITPYELMLCFCQALTGGSDGALSSLSMLRSVSANSAYAPLCEKINELSKSPSRAVALGVQHLQGTYQQRIISLTSTEA